MSTRSLDISEVAQPGFMGGVRGGNAPVDPALQELGDLCSFRLRQSRVEEGLQPVERKQRMQQQVGAASS